MANEHPGPFFKHASVPCCVVNSVGRIQAVNPAWAKLFASPPLDQPRLRDCIDHRDQDEVVRILESNVSEAHPLVRIAGGRRWVSLHMSHAESKWYIVAEDRSAERRARASLSEKSMRLRAILDHMGQAFLHMDSQGVILDVNKAATDLFGYHRHDLLGRELHLLNLQLEFDDSWDQLTPGRSVRLHRRLRKRHGESFDADLSVTVMEHDGARTLLVILSDASLHRAAEAEVRRLHIELEEARDTAIGENQAKSHFLANMSHELRTPLNAIIGYTELLMEDATDNDLQDMLADLQKVHGGARNLLGLINDILDLSKIEAGRMELLEEPFTLGSLVEELEATAAPLALRGDNQLLLCVDLPGNVVTTDRTRLRQCLLNLLGNACKFTQSGTITLSTQVLPNHILFSVEDTGIGIDPSKVPGLFDPFTQADSTTTRHYGGTGLGLAITNKFVDMMGGHVRVESQQGQGSTFIIQIPRQIHTAQVVDVVTSAGSATQGTTVLIIDDDPATHDLLNRLLSREGYRVFGAQTGVEGLDLARVLQPAAVMLDVMMPGIDGWNVITQLKSSPETRSIPVIMMSVLEQAEKSFSMGAVDFLIKPFKRQDLLHSLARFRPSRQGTVLVVDDAPEVRELAQRVLTGDGWSVLLADGGHQALEHLQRTVPDAMLLDLMMPGMDGFEVIGHLRKRREWSQIPVVVFTAMSLSKEERDYLNAHVHGVLTKGGSSIEDLVDTLSRVVRPPG